MRTTQLSLLACGLVIAGVANAGTLTYGDMDCLGQGCYGASDPTAGATLQGLAVNSVTFATTGFGHGYPFVPGGSDFAGTDQIYVGSGQTGTHDGYSVSTQRIAGPDILTLDYSSLVGAGQTVTGITLGIAADDFQFPDFGQPFIVTLNGGADPTLLSTLEGLNQSGPVVQFFTIGVDPALDTGAHTLTLSIDEGGDGGDGWAVDFLTVGITTSSASTPEPATVSLLAGGLLAGLALARRRK